MPYFYAFASALASYKIFNIFSHPDSKLWQAWPRLKFKRVDFFPSQRITVKGRVIHFHHWLNFSILLCISFFVSVGVLDSWITRGALLGGIIQGLSIPSARKIIYK